MAEYNVLKKRRNMNQVFMGGLFLVVLIGGWFYPLLGYFIPLCMLFGMAIGIFEGRKWCDWLCPRGSFFDSIIKPISPEKKIPPFFKGLPLRIITISFLMLMMIVQLIKRWPNPYKIGMFFVILLTITTILGIILALIFHQRTWCSFCPIGSMANWIGKKKHLLKLDSKLCTECGICYKVCPIQVAPFSATNHGEISPNCKQFGGKFKKTGVEIVKDSDCLKCALCVSACPKKALNLERGKI